jgi:hypothetical protein
MAVDAGTINAEVRLLLQDLKKDVLKVESNLNKITKKSEETTNKMGFNFKKLGGTIATVFAAKKVFDFGLRYIRLADAQIQAEKRLETVLKSTQNQVGLTAEQIKSYASELQKVTTFGDEAILGAQNLLLTFTKIGGEIFPQVTETVLNMSTAFKQGLKESAIQLGKALNDPIQGVTALRRVGVQLTDTQEAQIKKFTELGQIQKAQKIILGELETQVGGAARAATAGAGSIEQFKNALGDLGEETGKKLLKPLNKLLGFMTDLITEEDSLEIVTKELVKVSGEYAKITKTLAEESESLTEKEKEKLEIRKAELSLDIAKSIENVNKLYKEQNNTIDKNTKKLAFAKSEQARLTKLIKDQRKAIEDGTFAEESLIEARANLGVALNLYNKAFREEKELTIENKVATGQLNEALNFINEGLENGLITRENLVGVNKELIDTALLYKESLEVETETLDANTDAADKNKKTKFELAVAEKEADKKRLESALVTGSKLIDISKNVTDSISQSLTRRGKNDQEAQKRAARAARVAAVFEKAITISRIIANTRLAMAQALAASPLTGGQPWRGLALFNGILDVAAVVTRPLPPMPTFAFGGIVPGQRSQGVDSTTAKVTPGEMILNDAQQANLFDQINNGAGGQIVINIITEGGEQLDRIVQERTTNGEMNVHVNGLIGVVT